jgi:hypothetical protein
MGPISKSARLILFMVASQKEVKARTPGPVMTSIDNPDAQMTCS